MGLQLTQLSVSAEKHIQERLSNGETESVLMLVHSKMGSAQSVAVSKKSAHFEKKGRKKRRKPAKGSCEWKMNKNKKN